LCSLDDEDVANLTKEEIREMIYKCNFTLAIEPPPPSESGSGSGDTESGTACITSTVNVLLSTKGTTYSEL